METGLGGWRSAGIGNHGQAVQRDKSYIFLLLAAMEKGYSDNRWLTYKQMEDKGWHFKTDEEGKSLGKGAGVAIEYFEFRDKTTKQPLDRHMLDGMTAEERAEYMDENVYSFRKYYRVFNGDVIEGIPERTKEKRDPMGYNARAEALIDFWSDTESPIRYGGTSAYYSPKTDEIHLPPKTEIRRVELRKFLRAIPILTIGIVAALAAVGCASTEGAEPTKPSDARAEYTPVGYAFAVDGTCEHSYEAVQAITATCTDQGYTVYTCANCGDSYTDNFVAASGHAFQDITVPATCTHKGYVTHFCTVCGYEYSDTFVDEKGHSYLDEVIAPTCAEQGYTQHTCSVCGYSYRDSYVQAFGHNYTEAVTEPTCTDVGYTTHTCRTCGSEVISDYISPNWHLYEQTVHPATCVSYGYTEHVCSECGDRHVTDYQKAMGHTYLDIVVEATQDSLGYTRHLCIVCNYSYLSDFVTSGDDGYIEKEPVHEHQYELQVQDFEADQYFIALRVCICGDSRVGNLNIQFSDANGETVQLSPNEYGQVDYSGLYGEWLVTILDEKGEQLTVFDFSAGEAPEEPTEPDLPDEGAEPGEPPVVGDEEQSDEEIVQGPSDEGEGPTEPETPDDDGEQENPDEGETPEELQEPADETAGSGSGTAIILLIVFLLLVVGGVVAVIFLKKKKNKGQN